MYAGIMVAPELVAFALGSFGGAYFMNEAIDEIANAETERELLAAELSLGFMVFGWVASAGLLGRSALKFRQALPELRAGYNETVRPIPELNQQWRAEGIPLAERAFRAYAIRHNARLQTRALTEQELNVRNLEVRDFLKYGNKDGPSFENMIEIANQKGYYGDAAYEYIITAGARTSAAHNEAAAAARGSSSP